MKENVERIATVPLRNQPGERWTYGHNTDVLGRLIELISGEPLDQFCRRRVLDPLGMEDTYFFIPDSISPTLEIMFITASGLSDMLSIPSLTRNSPNAGISDGPWPHKPKYFFRLRQVFITCEISERTASSISLPT